MTAAAIAPALLSGAANFRAVKPYRAAAGRSLKPDMIFRSGELSRLTGDDLNIIAGLGIKLICDLRTGREQAEYISRWPDGSLHRKLDAPGRDESDAGPHKIFELIVQNPGETGGLAAMDRLYRRQPKAMAGSLALLFTTILAGDALPLLVHCHAGKDRTGFIIAMLLTALGVSQADVIDDYVTTAIYFPVEQESRAVAGWAKRSFGHDIDPAAARPLVDARPHYLAAAFAEIETGWGSTAHYLRDAAGLTTGDAARLQDLLLH